MKKENYKKIVDLRHELHRHPELSCKEVWTRERLMDFVRKNTGLEVVDKGAYFYAVYRAEDQAGKRKGIAFRADFDALPIEDRIDKPYRSEVPGVGHKCGHDGHAAALCGLCLEVEDLSPDRDVYMLFQHAEETGKGAAVVQDCIKENPDIAEIYGFHNQPGVPEGKIVVPDEISNCASKGMSVFMTGKPTHASHPENGRNPVFALARVVGALKELTDPEQYEGLVMCTVVQLDVGAYAFGTAASEGVLRMTIRAGIEREMDVLQERIERLSEKEAEKDGLKVRFEFDDYFPETRNTPSAVKKVYRAAEKLGYDAGKKETELGSEDFGYYTKLVPGAIFFIGDGEDFPSLHTSAFDFNDAILENAVEMFKALIVDPETV